MIIKSVFKIIGTLLASLILFGLLFGSVGRTFTWNAVEPAFQNHWASITMNDGKTVSDALGTVFDEAIEINGR